MGQRPLCARVFNHGIHFFTTDSRALVAHALFRAAKGGELNRRSLGRIFVVNGAVLVFALIAAVFHDASLRSDRLEKLTMTSPVFS